MLKKVGAEPVRFGPPVFARHGDAGWMNDISLNAAGPQPARQPEAVATGLISDGDARDGTPRLGGFVLPAAEQAKQHRLIGVDLLERVAGDPGHDRGHEPARLAHLDDGNEGAGLIEGEKGSAQVIMLRHEKLQGWFDQRWCFTLAGLHSFSKASPQRQSLSRATTAVTAPATGRKTVLSRSSTQPARCAAPNGPPSSRPPRACAAADCSAPPRLG